MLTRFLVTVFQLLFAVSAALAMQPPSPQSEFVPIDKLPPADQLQSAPLLVGAYAFVWIAVMFYLWTIWRRLDKVESDMRLLEQKTSSGRR